MLPLAGAATATILLGAVGFVTIASFSVTIVLGQAYLPSRVGLASGITLGLAIGLGGVAATALGLVADAAGLPAVLWTIALLPVPGDRARLQPADHPSRPAHVRRRTVAGCADRRRWARWRNVTEQRRSPRAKVKVRCMLHRRTGSPITGHTVDLGPGGMCVCTTRPLAADEVVRFELPPDIDGRGRVLRQQGRDIYAVRFELLGEPALAELHRLAMAPAQLVRLAQPGVLQRGEAGDDERLEGDPDLTGRARRERVEGQRRDAARPPTARWRRSRAVTARRVGCLATRMTSAA